MKHRIKFFKPTAWVVILAFFFQDAAFALELKPLNLNSSEEKSLKWAQSQLPTIPQSVAVIEDAYKEEASAKTIIHIQDAHTNYSGQINVAKILDILFSKDPIKYVFLEAGYGDESLSFLRKYATQEKREEVAKRFVRNADLQGSEYTSLASDHDFVMWGVENMSLYGKSVELYRQIAAEREHFENYLNKIEATIKFLKTKICNPLLISFDQGYQKYLREEISATEYYELLKKTSDQLSVPLAAYPHFKNLEALLNLESKIDFKKANEEMAKAVSLLSQDDQKELEESSQKNAALAKLSGKDKQTEAAWFMLLAEKLNGSMKNYAELAKYFDYLRKAQEIDLKKVLDEEKNIEQDIFKALVVNKDEEVLVAASSNVALLKKMFYLTLTPEEFEDYRKNTQNFDIARITGFINKKIMDLGNHHDRAMFLEEGYGDAIKRCEEFYTLTYDRDKEFVKNLSQKMSSESQSQAILITGGYHSPNLKSLLKQQGFSYISLTPQIYRETNQKVYEEKLLRAQASSYIRGASVIAASHSMPVRILTLGEQGAGAALAGELNGTADRILAEMKQHESALSSVGARLARNDQPITAVRTSGEEAAESTRRGSLSTPIVSNPDEYLERKGPRDLSQEPLKLVRPDDADGARLVEEISLLTKGSDAVNTEILTTFGRELREVSAVAADWDKTVFHPKLTDTPSSSTTLADYFALIQASLIADEIEKVSSDKRDAVIKKWTDFYFATQGRTDIERFLQAMSELKVSVDEELAKNLAKRANQELVSYLTQHISVWRRSAGSQQVFVPGALDLFVALKKKFGALGYIVTASQYVELSRLVPGLGLEATFDGGVYGAVGFRTKSEMLKEVAAKSSGRSGSILFFGDGTGDVQAGLEARKEGVHVVIAAFAHTPEDAQKLKDAGADILIHGYKAGETTAFSTPDEFFQRLIGAEYFKSLVDQLKDGKAPRAPKLINGNFTPTSHIRSDERHPGLARVAYEDIDRVAQYHEPNPDILLIRNPLEGGVGYRIERMEALMTTLGVGRDEARKRLASKATDIYDEVTLDGFDSSGNPDKKLFSVSIAEFNLLGTLNELPLYGASMLQPLLRDESDVFYQELWDTTYLPDRLDDRIKEKRTYRQAAKDLGLLIGKRLAQDKNPLLDKKSGSLSIKNTGPSGHAYWPFYFFSTREGTVTPREGMTVIRSLYNGDNFGHPDEVIVRAMAHQRVPIVMVTTERAAVDEKVGLLGIETLADGSERVAMLEAAEAKKNDEQRAGQWESYLKTGLVLGYGAVGEQDTNTNDALINETVLYPFLEDLEKLIGHEEFAKTIRPDLLHNGRVIEGESFDLLEGAMGTVYLNLHNYIEKNRDNAGVAALLNKHQIKQILQFVYIGKDRRTQMFSRIQSAFDAWFFSTNRYEKDYLRGVIRDANGEYSELPFVDIRSTYYAEIQSVKSAFGSNADVLGLNSLKIDGVFLMKDAIYRGSIEMQGTSERTIDLNDARYADILPRENGRLVLENIKIVAGADGSITVSPIAGARLALSAINPTGQTAWKALSDDFAGYGDSHLRGLFASDPSRAQRMSLEFVSDGAAMYVDYSKQLVTDGVLGHLMDLARQTKLGDAISLMFNGDRINETEDRAVLHTALRMPRDKKVLVDGEDVVPSIHSVLDRMKVFSDAVNSGEWTGYTGKRIMDVVNIGIGGSDLGPVMVTEALKPYATGNVNIHFVSNVDGTDISEKVLKKLDPETTLFIIASKTFTTQETMTNAETAKKWFLEAAQDGDAVKKHFVALSTNREAVEKFGIDPANMFQFWDWVGGRYSLWSAIGLSISTYIGFDNFRELLGGAYDMDEHFRNADFENNIPVILGLLSIWNANFLGAQNHAILPYDQYLHRLAAYLQQAAMESNGKGVDRNGNRLNYAASPVLFGEAGTNGQHSFYQLLHQGLLVPADFIGVSVSQNPVGDHHPILLANFFAQTQALAFGKTLEEVLKEGADPAVAPYKVFEGNRPTTSILINQLTPRALGALIAMYEHQIFVEGVILNIYSYDQWGVELGKVNAKPVLSSLMSGQPGNFDASTTALLAQHKKYTAGARLSALENAEWVTVSGAELDIARSFGTNGLRADDLTAESMRRLAKGTAEVLLDEWTKNHAGEALPWIAVGFDPRPQGENGFNSGEMGYAKAMAETVAAYGFPVLFFGKPVAAPFMIAATGKNIHPKNIYAALMGTASHNEVVDPKSGQLIYGMKLFTENAPAPDALTGQISAKLNDKAEAGKAPKFGFDEAVQAGRIVVVDENDSDDIEKIEWDRLNKVFDFNLLGEEFRELFPDLKFAINTMHGGMSGFAVKVFEALGVPFTAFNTTLMNNAVNREKMTGFVEYTDGAGVARQVRFAPDPTREWMRGKDYLDFVAQDPSRTIGTLIDGDADRLVVELGKEVIPNEIGMLAVYYLAKYKGQKGRIVRTTPTTEGLDVLAEALELGSVSVTPVGSKWFKGPNKYYDATLEDILVAVEESGHIGFRYKGELFFDHSIGLNLLMMEMMSKTGKTWNELLDEMWAFVEAKTGQKRMASLRGGIAKNEGADKYYDLVARLGKPSEDAFRQEFGAAFEKALKVKGLDWKIIGYDITDAGGAKFRFSERRSVMPRKSGTDGSVRLYEEVLESERSQVPVVEQAMREVMDQFTSGARLAEADVVLSTKAAYHEALLALSKDTQNQQLIQFAADTRHAFWDAVKAYAALKDENEAVAVKETLAELAIIEAQAANIMSPEEETTLRNLVAGARLAGSNSERQRESWEKRLKRLHDQVDESRAVIASLERADAELKNGLRHALWPILAADKDSSSFRWDLTTADNFRGVVYKIKGLNNEQKKKIVTGFIALANMLNLDRSNYPDAEQALRSAIDGLKTTSGARLADFEEWKESVSLVQDQINEVLRQFKLGNETDRNALHYLKIVLEPQKADHFFRNYYEAQIETGIAFERSRGDGLLTHVEPDAKGLNHQKITVLISPNADSKELKKAIEQVLVERLEHRELKEFAPWQQLEPQPFVEVSTDVLYGARLAAENPQTQEGREVYDAVFNAAVKFIEAHMEDGLSRKAILDTNNLAVLVENYLYEVNEGDAIPVGKLRKFVELLYDTAREQAKVYPFILHAYHTEIDRVGQKDLEQAKATIANVPDKRLTPHRLLLPIYDVIQLVENLSREDREARLAQAGADASLVEAKDRENFADILSDLMGSKKQELATLTAEYKKEGANKKDIEAKINTILDELNVLKLSGVDSFKNFELAKPDALVDEFVRGEDHEQYRNAVEKSLLEGSYVPLFIFAGAATRLFEDVKKVLAKEDLDPADFRMYGLDIWQVLRTLQEQSDESLLRALKQEEIDQLKAYKIPEHATTLGMGPRQIVAYRLLLEKLAREKGQNVSEVMARQTLVFHINEEITENVLADFIKNDFYGFDRSKVVFIIQPVFEGYDLRPDGSFVLDANSAALPYGHGYATTQLVHADAFVLDENGAAQPLAESALDTILKHNPDSIVATHRVNDATKFDPELVVDLDKTALALSLIREKSGLVVDLVGNPAGAKGGNFIHNPATNQSFLIETSNVKGDQDLSTLLESAAKTQAPYNAFRLTAKASDYERLIKDGLRYNLRFKNGFYYLESVTGDLTQNPESRSSAIQREGDLIHDFKQLANLLEALGFVEKEDTAIKAAAGARLAVQTPQGRIVNENTLRRSREWLVVQLNIWPNIENFQEELIQWTERADSLYELAAIVDASARTMMAGEEIASSGRVLAFASNALAIAKEEAISSGLVNKEDLSPIKQTQNHLYLNIVDPVKAVIAMVDFRAAFLNAVKSQATTIYLHHEHKQAIEQAGNIEDLLKTFESSRFVTKFTFSRIMEPVLNNLVLLADTARATGFLIPNVADGLISTKQVIQSQSHKQTQISIGLLISKIDQAIIDQSGARLSAQTPQGQIVYNNTLNRSKKWLNEQLEIWIKAGKQRNDLIQRIRLADSIYELASIANASGSGIEALAFARTSAFASQALIISKEEAVNIGFVGKKELSSVMQNQVSFDFNIVDPVRAVIAMVDFRAAYFNAIKKYLLEKFIIGEDERELIRSAENIPDLFSSLAPQRFTIIEPLVERISVLTETAESTGFNPPDITTDVANLKELAKSSPDERSYGEITSILDRIISKIDQSITNQASAGARLAQEDIVSTDELRAFVLKVYFAKQSEITAASDLALLSGDILEVYRLQEKKDSAGKVLSVALVDKATNNVVVEIANPKAALEALKQKDVVVREGELVSSDILATVQLSIQSAELALPDTRAKQPHAFLVPLSLLKSIVDDKKFEAQLKTLIAQAAFAHSRFAGKGERVSFFLTEADALSDRQRAILSRVEEAVLSGNSYISIGQAKSFEGILVNVADPLTDISNSKNTILLPVTGIHEDSLHRWAEVFLLGQSVATIFDGSFDVQSQSIRFNEVDATAIPEAVRGYYAKHLKDPKLRLTSSVLVTIFNGKANSDTLRAFSIWIPMISRVPVDTLLRSAETALKMVLAAA